MLSLMGACWRSLTAVLRNSCRRSLTAVEKRMLAITDRRCEKRVMAIADRLSMPIQLTFPPCWRSVIAECMLAIFDRISVCVHICMLALT